MKFAPVIATQWADPADNEANIAWARAYADALAPYSEAGGYINFMDSEDQSRVRSNYGPNWDRLVAIKSKYDPGNLFRVNQNIAPA
ncbi:FAD/FMN-containing dehydrogenase [Paenarthrobacter nicotinovorans]|uniref:FAD/FMN-containing dehydrogenase n=2 Tax=Micrococcaceae TaxID=1268 RepID=A0ABT9TMD9_PAENI|nr:BBE domain-containing protein [Paenarthrobacter nicotinovorans]MDQ0102028.1 FAD/FMN-containing dehydrogenase [Paenarthrobacter nicotinovorans]